MSNLAGLYPPKEGQIWNPDLLWQSIPVHTVPVDDDNIIGNHAKCPKYEKLLKNIENLPELQKVKAENDWVFKYLTENTGKDREAFRTLVESLVQMTTFISRIFLKLVDLQFKVPISAE